MSDHAVQNAQMEEQDDDMENIRLRMDRRRREQASVDPVQARNDRKNALCNKIQEMKNSFPGLRERVNALQDTDPDMAAYIRKLEALSEDFFVAPQADAHPIEVPALLEKMAQRLLDAEDQAAKLRTLLRAQDDFLKELRTELKKYVTTHVVHEHAHEHAPEPVVTPTPATSKPTKSTLSWDGFDASELNTSTLPDFSAYVRGELTNASAGDLLD
jgi:hypothetical protein